MNIKDIKLLTGLQIQRPAPTPGSFKIRPGLAELPVLKRKKAWSAAHGVTSLYLL
jgi:hypothetical protein